MLPQAVILQLKVIHSEQSHLAGSPCAGDTHLDGLSQLTSGLLFFAVDSLKYSQLTRSPQSRGEEGGSIASLGRKGSIGGEGGSIATRSPHSRGWEGGVISHQDHRTRRGAGPKARLKASAVLAASTAPLGAVPSPLGWTGPPAGPRRRAMTRDLWSGWASERGPGSISGGRVRRHPPAP